MQQSNFLTQLITSFEKMDYRYFEQLLDKDKLYQEIPQPYFLKNLKRLFDQYNRCGNTRLKTYAANAKEQVIGQNLFLFIGTSSSNFSAIYFQIEGDKLIDMGECLDFESVRKSLKIKDRILLDDSFKAAEEESSAESFKTLEVMRGNTEPKFVMKRKDLSIYLKQFKDKFDSIDFKNPDKLALDFPNSNEEIDEENFAIFHRKYTLFRSFYKMMTQKPMFMGLLVEISDLIKSNNKSGALNWYHKNKNLFDELELSKFILLTYDDGCIYEQIYRDYWCLKKDIIHLAKLVSIDNIFQLEIDPLDGEKQNFMSEMRSILRISTFR